MANRPTAQTFNNDVAMLWLLKNTKTVYRSILALAESDTSGEGLSTDQGVLATWNSVRGDFYHDLTETISSLEETFRSTYATSDSLTDFEQTVAGTYLTNEAFTAQYNTIQSNITTSVNDGIGSFSETLRGQIVRGFMANPDYDPENPQQGVSQYLYGIMISTQNSLTGQTGSNQNDSSDKNTYWEIDLNANPTFGFYTSEGWQFWIGGSRVGWYNSKDGKLHTNQQEITNDASIGDWLLSSSGGFGIKYIGS